MGTFSLPETKKDAIRSGQSVLSSSGTTLVVSEKVRTDYKAALSKLTSTDSELRTKAKIKARMKTPAVMREVAENMRPISKESSRVSGTANKTNTTVNKQVNTLGKVGKVATGLSVAVSTYNVSQAENKVEQTIIEGGAFAGAVAGGEMGAEAGAAIGAFVGGAGAVPGAIIGGVIGSIAGGFVGETITTSNIKNNENKKSN